MADDNLKEYAGGWITERKNTEIPTFLKWTYIVVGCAGIAYLILYLYGEVSHSERGPLVRQFNEATTTSPAFMYGVAALVAVFFVFVVAFAFRKSNHD